MRLNVSKIWSIVIVAFSVTSSSPFEQDQNLEYRNGNQHVTLIIISENAYLILNQPTKIKVKLENIDAEKLTISGRGLKSLDGLQWITRESAKLTFLVTPDEKSLVDGKWEMNMSENENGKMKWQHKFSIVVK
jgi:hypothetical protein